MKLKRVPYAKFRANGGYDYFEKLLQQKVNAHSVGRGKRRCAVQRLSVRARAGGRQARTSPSSSCASRRTIAPSSRRSAPPWCRRRGSEIYTALERNVVDGYGWPIQGIDELGLLPVTKRRLEPSFFVAPNEILVNLDVWKKLTPEQRKVLDDAAAWVKTWLDQYEIDENEKAKKLQADSGIKVVTFNDKDAARYLEIAYDTGWQEIMKIAPEHGPRLRELMSS